MKPAIVKQLLAQEAYREYSAFLQGIRLKVTGVVTGTGGQAYQPMYYRGQRANEQEDFPALGVAAACILQAQAPPLPFAVAEGFLNLHPQRVQLHDPLCCSVRVWQRSGNEPRVFVQLASALGQCPLTVGFPRAPWPTPVFPDQIELTGIGLFARQPAPTHIPGSGGRTGIQCGGIAPAWGLVESKLHFVPDPPQPVPPVALHLPKPGAAKARVGHDDRSAVCGQDHLQIAQKAPVRPWVVVACQGIYFLIDRQCSPPHGHCRLKHQMLVPRLTIRPIDEKDGAGSVGQHPLRDRSINGDPFVLQMNVAQQAVDALNVVFDKGRGRQLPAQIRERQSAAGQQTLDHFDQGAQSRLMYRWTSVAQPFMQQSNPGHAASSLVMERVATPIRTVGRMSLNPLSYGSFNLFRQDSWGYFRVWSQRMKFYACRFNRAPMIFACRHDRSVTTRLEAERDSEVRMQVTQRA